MTAVALGDGIRLLSGCLFDYNNPRSSAVEISDIAAALSKVCRFAGHIHQFYSVAQHAVNASRIVPAEHAFTALMHDTAEAFTNDLPTPLKFAIPVFKELEVSIEGAMAERFGFAYPLPDPVKLADLQMLALEKHYLKRDHSAWSVLEGIQYEHLKVVVDLSPMTSSRAERLFLERFAELASCDSRRMAETGTGSGRSPTSAVVSEASETPKAQFGHPSSPSPEISGE
jgi:hypothetical protein